MTIDRTSAVGLIVGVFLIIIVGLFIAQNSFPALVHAPSDEPLVSVTSQVGLAESTFLWANRTWDLIGQAFVLFAAAAGCLAILRIEAIRRDEDK